MRKLSLLVALGAVAALLAAPQVSADPPQHFLFVDDFHFQSGSLTAACGTPVFITIRGPIRIKLRTDREGAVHETDTFANWALTFSAPATGRSFSYKTGIGFFEYPEGIFLGAPAIVTFVGRQENVPGIHAEAGRVVFPAEIVFVSPEGLPFIAQTGPPTFDNRNTVSQAEARAATCAYLTG